MMSRDLSNLNGSKFSRSHLTTSNQGRVSLLPDPGRKRCQVPMHRRPPSSACTLFADVVHELRYGAFGKPIGGAWRSRVGDVYAREYWRRAAALNGDEVQVESLGFLHKPTPAVGRIVYGRPHDGGRGSAQSMEQQEHRDCERAEAQPMLGQTGLVAVESDAQLDLLHQIIVDVGAPRVKIGADAFEPPFTRM